MKKKIYLISSIAVALITGCAQNTVDPAAQPQPEQLQIDGTPNIQPTLGMPNPASQYCIEQQGKLEIRADVKGGQTGYCHLKNGEVVEEWQLFRASDQAKCVAVEAQKLVGQPLMSEEKIKQRTQAALVRVVGPNQPVTQDYRVNRVTVTVDPQSKLITHASCG